MAGYASKTRADAIRQNGRIADAFGDFRAAQVAPADVLQYLAPLRTRPRSYNAARAQLRELMRFAELLGWRPPGSNPTAPVRTMQTPARTRYITDSELRRIKIGAMRGDDGQRTRSGPMLCALIDVLYLTAQPIGDVLALDADDVRGPVITFRRAKVSASTGAAARVRVSPALRDAVSRLLRLRTSTGRDIVHAALVLTTDGQRARYDGIKSAWARACARAAVPDAHIHDIRAKALTDIERTRGMRAARVLAQHATEQQTADYVRAREAEIVDATR